MQLVFYGVKVGQCRIDELSIDKEFDFQKKAEPMTPEEIVDIQNQLIQGALYNDLIEQYKPRLTRTFLSNLNHGVNYKNPKLSYPLKKDFSGENVRGSRHSLRPARP